MVAEFDAFATRMTAPLSGLALLLTGDRNVATILVHAALTRAYMDRTPDDQRAVAGLVRAWLAGPPPVGESDGDLPYELELLRWSLDALPEPQRAAVVLHHWSGLAVPEIAAVLHQPERAVAADLDAGVAELHVPAPAEPDELPPTVEARLAALVSAAGPPLVDLAGVVKAGKAQRRNRRRTAIAAAGVLIAIATAATLLTAGEPEPGTSERAPVSVVGRFEEPGPVIDDRARRLTAQLAAAIGDLLPVEVPPPEFAVNSADSHPDTYVANAGFGRTMLIFVVAFRAGDEFVPCSEPDRDCTYRQFPDGTVAEVVAQTEVDRTALSLDSRRPDGTAFHVLAYGIGAPELTVEDMFGFATVVTY